MTASRLLRLAALALLSFGSLCAAATAMPANPDATRQGGVAITIAQANVRSGPGTDYPVLFTLGANVPVAVAACTDAWCAVVVTQEHGFIARQYLIFDSRVPTVPTVVPSPKPKPAPQSDEDAQVCFFTAPDFNGPSFCASPGDEALFVRKRFDDAIESILLDPGVVVKVCTEEDLDGRCQTFNQSKSRLPRYLRDDISSYTVYADQESDDDGNDLDVAPQPQR